MEVEISVKTFAIKYGSCRSSEWSRHYS